MNHIFFFLLRTKYFLLERIGNLKLQRIKNTKKESKGYKWTRFQNVVAISLKAQMFDLNTIRIANNNNKLFRKTQLKYLQWHGIKYK